MMKPIRLLLLLLPVFFISLPGNFVFAGSSQASGEIHFKPEKIIKFAKKVEKTLAQKGARAAIIARVGRPRNKLPEGIRFTHTA
ncbi:MAG: hypothetical protein MI799_18055, partial [Desulfobacterales bacterium]|nr:hypothetical protein [Desulfobacterales bacterium]